MLTTPESLDLHRYLHQMASQQISHVTMEVSSSGLELQRVGSVEYDIVVLNNISREHIDLHGSFENYLSAKVPWSGKPARSNGLSSIWTALTAPR